LGGLTTVLDVKVKDYPTHAASLPVAIIPNCAATRHIEFELDGSGPAILEAPNLDEWPTIPDVADGKSQRVNLDTLYKADTSAWKVGDRLLLSGTILTARDAAHKRLVEMLNGGEELPVNFDNRFIYYVGPVDPVRDEIVGPAGPTTSSRMDKFMETMFSKTGILGSIGKSERGDDAVETFRMHGAIHLIAIGGAAYLISKSIRTSRQVAFGDLGMEAIYEFKVEDMPVTVAIDSGGNSIHQIGPARWRNSIGNIPVVSAKHCP
jgi:fumarate hydratase class I